METQKDFQFPAKREIFTFRKDSVPDMVNTQPLIQWVMGFFPQG
jgi:hypothetical protein